MAVSKSAPRAAAAMAIAVETYDGTTLTVRAPLAPNRNLHGTAFAGALFSVCVLTGWGATWLRFREQGLTGLIVVADSRIEYHKAVTGDIAGVTEGLGVAFNSTLVALLISIVLMFLLHQLQLAQERLVLDSETYLDQHLIRHRQVR
mgnify:CR=1 FL=1